MYNSKVKVVRLTAHHNNIGAFSHNTSLVIINSLTCNIQQLTKALAEREFGQWQKASIRLSCAKCADIRQGDIITYKGDKQEYEVLDVVHRATHTLVMLGLYGGMIARKSLHEMVLRDNSGLTLRDVDNKILRIGGDKI